MTEIKVGSEWVLKTNDNRRCKILYVGKKVLFAEWREGNEDRYKISDFLEFYKPAPVRRTVWLNVYDGYADCYNSENRADSSICSGLLFQQEVELIDPRDRERGE